MKKLKRLLSMLLVVTLLLPTLAACGNGSDKSDITATAVKFSKNGKYTTTVKSKKVDLSGINADNIEVRYMDPSADSSMPVVSQEDETQTPEKEYHGGLKYMLSANYAIDSQGKVGLYVPGKGCSYYTGNRKNDERALTIVLSSAKNGERTFTKQTYNKLVDLTAYLCDQYGIKELVWSDDKDVRKNHSNGANVTLVSDYYIHTDAPGGYLLDRMDDFINDVNYKLDYVN